MLLLNIVTGIQKSSVIRARFPKASNNVFRLGGVFFASMVKTDQVVSFDFQISLILIDMFLIFPKGGKLL